jgi:undecaprenyl diphosphate synthase
MSLFLQLDKNNIPKHVAIIMDGNGRWAKKQGKERIFGHQAGVESVRLVVEAAAEAEVKYLTLYAFSTENWNRPKHEVDALMELLVNTIVAEIGILQKNNISLHAIGNLESLPGNCNSELQKAIKLTSANTGLNLVLALSYSSKWEIINAVKLIVNDVENKKLLHENITESVFEKYLCTHSIPNPELLIRTSGECRISNFLLWQIAYTELYFTNKLWPEFGKEDFFEAIINFQHRERRFGLTSEQL